MFVRAGLGLGASEKAGDEENGEEYDDRDAGFRAYASEDDLAEEDEEFAEGVLHGKRRKRMRRDDDDATYGIFNPAYGNAEKSQRRKQQHGQDTEKKPIQPIQFVASSAPPLTSEDVAGKRASESDKTTGKEDEASRQRDEFRRLVLGVDGMLEGDKKDARKKAEKLKAQKNEMSGATLDPLKALAFAKYGKGGFALKFMQKFNFTGRLGKNKSGISEPLAVKARPERLALGGGGFKEATTLEQNKRIHREQFGESEEDARSRKLREREQEEEAELAALWKRVKENRAKPPKAAASSTGQTPGKAKRSRFRTAAEVLADQKNGAPQGAGAGKGAGKGGYVIIDMRAASTTIRNASDGVEAAGAEDDNRSVASSSSSGSSSSSSSSSSSAASSADSRVSGQSRSSLALLERVPGLEVSVGKEMSNKLERMVDDSQKTMSTENIHVQRLEATITDKEASLSKLQKDAAQAQAAAAQGDAALAALTEAFEAAESRMVSWAKASSRSLAIMQTYWDAYHPAENEQVQASFAFVEDDAAMQLAQDLLHAWGGDAASGKRFACSAGADAWSAELDDLRTMLSAWIEFLRDRVHVDEARIIGLVESTVLVTIEQEVCRAWMDAESARDKGASAARDARLAADAFAHAAVLTARDTLPRESAFASFAERVVMPELEHRVDRWHLSSKSLGRRLDLWIVPWVDVLRKPIRSTLHRPIRQVLVKALRRKCKSAKDVKDWALDVVKPWREVLSENTFTRLLAEGLVPLLVELLRGLVVERDLDRQDMESVLAVVSVSVLFPPASAEVRALFLGEFFPRWLQALRMWIGTPRDPTQAIDWGQVAAWFRGWRRVLAPALHSGDKVLLAPIGRALGLMASASGARPADQSLYGVARQDDERAWPKMSSYEQALEELGLYQVGAEARAPSKSRNRNAAEGVTQRADELSARDFVETISGPVLHTTFMRHPKHPISDEGLPVFLLGARTALVFAHGTARMASPGSTTNFQASTLEQVVAQAKRDG